MMFDVLNDGHLIYREFYEFFSYLLRLEDFHAPASCTEFGIGERNDE